ncbi:MAG: error-prone DNA polymerase [Alphaproteobacteria bacterium]|jgi:error-prone DNA polymerase|nr:error-prone DNA polymerase [Alphaproteobacteria bacterium]MDP6621318.1 error-prone DNA polymerase [Alphaproteobacteria bacterium]
MTGYAELQVTSNFSFLCGASHPEELVAEAAALGHEAVAITDRNTFAGVVRAHVAAREAGIRLLVGVRLDLHDGPSLLAFPCDRAAYGRLSRLLTLGKRRAPKGECELGFEDLLGEANGAAAGQILIALPPPELDPGAEFAQALRDLKRRAAGPVYLAAHYLYRGDDRRRLRRLAGLAAMCATPLVATNDVLAHAAWRRPLQDVLTCIREHCTIDEAGWRLQANAERHLKPAAEMARLFADYPEALERSREIAAEAAFSLEELRYEYPDETAPGGCTPQVELERLTWRGAGERYPDGLPERVRGLVERELELVAELDYAPYFLTVHDIVRFARSRGILCQGRGSAANSAVCYCLGITAVDPDRIDLLFERFVSAERNEPPDIDVDFEHERREEVIQYIYEKYGRERAGLTATVISYRTRSAVREVCKALGLSQDVAGALVGTVWGGGRSRERLAEERVREAGLDPTDRRLAMALELAHELRRFPRHLSQHVGGFVITRGPLSELSPIANAAMEDRTVIEWDKDDLDALGILKIDVLGLGMLSCVRKSFELIARHYGRQLDLASVPAEDSRVYDMLCRADSVGVFQVESRAQMSMLPRLKPRDFYDLVIEVAIVRPGPIQGDMVHPYLRRRSGEEEVDYPSPELEEVLGKTLGVPLFQEQAMRIAMVGAGFSPSEADRLRRAMATFRRSGQIQNFRQKFIDGMVGRGYEHDFAERCFKQIEGFGEYGFPESHAASFALLVYVSSWLKCHYPSAFAAALLNSQPMGFYAPAQIVRDARDHGVVVRPVDVNHSTWNCTLERHSSGVALRLGLRQIKGCKQDHAEQLVAARDRPYEDVFDLWRRSGLPATALETLARGDAFRSLGLDRRAAFWAVRGLADAPLPLFAAAERRETQARFQPEAKEAPVKLPEAALGEQVIDDYAALRLSLKRHPLALLRPGFAAAGVLPAADLAEVAPESWVTVAGLVICRQRPGTASGVVFVTLEDETGVANLVVWPKVFERYRKAVLRSRLMQVRGTVQREGLVIHLIAQRIDDLSHRLGELATGTDQGTAAPLPARAGSGGFRSRDFH